jgi:hypothetical protein
MSKGYKMIKYIIILCSFTILLQANPYKNLDDKLKINLMVNYFLNNELKNIVPKKPIKEKLKDDGLSVEPIKYEKYYNYIQRIKAIHESRLAEQKDIDEKYIEKVVFYNGKLKVLKRFYTKIENLNPFLQTSINKAFTVVYGKPIFKDIIYDKITKSLVGMLSIEDIYNISKFNSKNITIQLPECLQQKFLQTYQDLSVQIQFDYKNNQLSFKNIIFELDGKEYLANFKEKIKEKIKLDIKINNDIFRLIKIKRG